MENGLYSFLIFLFFSTIIYIIFFGILPMYRIKKIHKELSENLTDSGVEKFIHSLSRIKVPKQPFAWDALEASYNMIKSCPKVSRLAKEKAKKALVAKGVPGIR